MSETSVLILCQQKKFVSRSSPFFNRVSPSLLPHLLQFGLASLSFFALCCLFCFALTGGYHVPGVLGRGLVCMYLPLSSCLSIHGLTLFALCDALRVAKGSAPLRQLGL